MKRTLRLGTLAATLLVPSLAFADTVAQTLPFTQDWTDTGLITANDTWTGVPGITGYLGGVDPDLANDSDPQLVVTAFTVVDVIANLTAVSISGGVAEFHFADPVVAFQGSGTADAPNLVFYLNTSGVADVRVEYDLIDLDSNTDDSVQQVALQYRLATTGDFINVPGGYVADATADGAAGQVTHINLVIPEIANQAYVELRVLTTNAGGSDEWVGVDNISIRSANTPPAAVGASTPASESAGATVQLTALVTPGSFPASTGLAVVCDLTAIGGSATAALLDDGASGDAGAGDNLFGLSTTIAAATAAGLKSLPCTVSDAELRSSNFTISLTVTPVCGDGIAEGGEECDDDDLDPGDGCSATCTEETGYDCVGTAPSVCTDIDECTAGTDNCSDDAGCANTTGGFTCVCNTGFTGDGVTCTDIDECTDMTDDCHADATCTNTPGDFTCACNPGYAGDGVTTCTDIDECTTGADNCSANAACTNTDGSFTCACNTGFSGDGVTCAPICGDALIVAGEGCDDDGAEDGDGCSATCQTEAGWVCTGAPSVCTATCGDGLVVGGEECDDAGTTDGDGCDAVCVEEPGWMCTGEPSTCSEEALCGDGVVDAGEECDDGNDAGDDGCDATCTEETGWLCNDAEPSECVLDSDGDLIGDDEDNCPDLANPSQADEDDDGIGDICDEEEPPGDSGCCSTSSDSRSGVAGFALLALATLLTLRRRRR